MAGNEYEFDVFQEDTAGPIAHPECLAERPLAGKTRSLEQDAARFVPGEALATAIKVAICIGEPLLITGEPGTGKTQTAYYVAWKLGLGKVLHFQVKSESTAKDLLYEFDTVRYFQDAHLEKIPISGAGDETEAVFEARKKYITKGDLWIAFEAAENDGKPRILLIDEIDKAPRDFPNDLLHELDQMEILCRETNERRPVKPNLRPLVFITSNSERRLPEPFLRRCVYHHIRFDGELLDRILAARRDEFENLDDVLIDLAVDRFLDLRKRGFIKDPSVSEMLVWLRVLSLATGLDEKKLSQVRDKLAAARDDYRALPYLGVLLKNRQDLVEEG
jgi:MoxR-like ATPase